MLSSAETALYARQIVLPEVGISGQLRLKNASVLCIGAGGLGAPLLQYLAAAGIGRIGIVDHDVVETSNLQRQIIYTHDDIGKRKTDAAKNYLQRLNPHIQIDIYPQKFTAENAAKLIADFDMTADCTDQIANRYLVNAHSIAANKPFMYAGISRHAGQCMLFHGTSGPCFYCLFPDDAGVSLPPDCNAGGVLGVLPGLLGTMQANLIIQHLLRQNDDIGRLYAVNITNLDGRTYVVTKNPQCPVCVNHRGMDLIAAARQSCSIPAISAIELLPLLHDKQNIILLDVRTRAEHDADNIGGMLIPLDELPRRLPEIDASLPVIVYCKSGHRSSAAVKLLSENGVGDVRQLEGGIDEFRLKTSAFS
jgi:sulfur-carrier protein adenylyltransferase/sulfurtransferase